jgi:hypothetical protein
MSSLLVVLKNKKHIHCGREHKPGEVVRLPDDVAMQKIKRGEAELADGKKLVNEREKKKAAAEKRKAAEKKKAEKKGK